MNDDVKKAYDAITAKRKGNIEAWRYYLGNHPLVYASKRLEDVFSGVEVKFIENWCGVVVDSIRERIQLTGFTVPESAQEAVTRIWQDNQLNLESDDLHEGALVTGEGYLIAWPDEDGKAEIYFNDGGLCHVFYHAASPRRPRFAAKLWQDDDERAHLTLYYPDHLEYYAAAGKEVSSASAFQPDVSMGADGQAPNPYEEIPVFSFKGRRHGVGELMDIIPIQNGINKLLTDMMVAAEYGAFRQRWVISNSDVQSLKNAPNEIWNIPAGDGMGQSTSVGEFSPTDLGNYLKAIGTLAEDIARISRTPKHYFYGQGGDPSGEALIALEAPLNRKTQNRIERFTVAWQQAMAFALKIEQIAVTSQEVIPVFDDVETVQPRTRAEIRLLETQAGIPLITSLRREGWSDSELEDMAADKEADQAALGDGLLAAFDKGEEQSQA